jgi:drug/metabolite transporter (DMT)-like permease
VRMIRTPRAAPARTADDRSLLGIVTIIAALVFLPAMDAIAKLLSGHLSTLEITWARFVFYALALIPLALWKHGRAAVQSARPHLQLVRGTLLATSAFMFFCAIARMPLADAMAVFFIYPFVILLASTFMLGESSGWIHWAMVGVGFIGAALAAQPTFAGISTGTIFALAAAVAYASALMVTRRLASHDPSLVTSAISASLGALMFSCAVPFFWIAPTARDWLLMVVMGAIAAVGHFLIVAAHRLATASQLAPYGYTEIATAVVFGFLIFGDWPRPLVWVGIVLIVASGVGASWREANLQRRARRQRGWDEGVDAGDEPGR